MTQLSLSHTLVAGTAENINDVQDNFDDITTWANGGISDTNFASTAGQYAAYRTLQAAQGVIGGLVAASTRYFALGNIPVTSGGALSTTSGEAPVLFGFNSTDYTAGTKTQRLRLRAQCLVNATAPAVTFTLGLYPVSTVAGGSNTLTLTLGTVVSGSTVAFASPAAGAKTSSSGSDFAVPSAGAYCFGVVISGTTASNSVTCLAAQLQHHWV